jgi:hypothetical protein
MPSLSHILCGQATFALQFSLPPLPSPLSAPLASGHSAAATVVTWLGAQPSSGSH